MRSGGKALVWPCGSADARFAMLQRRSAMDTTASPILYCFLPRVSDTGSWKSSSQRSVWLLASLVFTAALA